MGSTLFWNRRESDRNVRLYKLDTLFDLESARVNINIYIRVIAGDWVHQGLGIGDRKCCDRYHFGRVFAREFGVTPAQYRKQGDHSRERI